MLDAITELLVAGGQDVLLQIAELGGPCRTVDEDNDRTRSRRAAHDVGARILGERGADATSECCEPCSVCAQAIEGIVLVYELVEKFHPARTRREAE